MTTKGTTPTPRLSGTVKWFSARKGFGFLTTDSGEEVFVHRSQVPFCPGCGHRNLRRGASVEFEVVAGPKGTQAVNVTVL